MPVRVLKPSTRTSTADEFGLAQAAASLPRMAARDGVALNASKANRMKCIFNEKLPLPRPMRRRTGKDSAPVHFPLQWYLGAVCGQIMFMVGWIGPNRGQGMANQ